MEQQMIIIKEILRTFYNCDENVKIDVECAMKNLSDTGGLTNEEYLVINATREQFNLASIAALLGMDDSVASKMAVSRIFERACGKLVETLGPDYQDTKVLKAVEIRLRRPLTKDEEYFCIKKITDNRLMQDDEINIYNFRIEEDGRIVKGEDKRQR